jgi:hypothetical protein
MAARICVVTVTDLRGIRRSVEVTASSVYEAGALAVAALREDGWSEPIGPATTLQIEVRPPAITHKVTVQQIMNWTESAALSPEDRLRKDQIRAAVDHAARRGPARR